MEVTKKSQQTCYVLELQISDIWWQYLCHLKAPSPLVYCHIFDQWENRSYQKLCWVLPSQRKCRHCKHNEKHFKTKFNY